MSELLTRIRYFAVRALSQDIGASVPLIFLRCMSFGREPFLRQARRALPSPRTRRAAPPSKTWALLSWLGGTEMSEGRLFFPQKINTNTLNFPFLCFTLNIAVVAFKNKSVLGKVASGLNIHVVEKGRGGGGVLNWH